MAQPMTEVIEHMHHAGRILTANATDDDDEVNAYIAWIVVPTLLGVLLYASFALCMWPYARPLFPFWVLFLAILIPPVFPFFLVYLLCILAATTPVARPPVVIVVEPSTRGRIQAGTSRRERSTYNVSGAAGNRV